MVKYPDGSSEEVQVLVVVTANPTDAEKYDPQVTPITKEYGMPTTEEEVKNAVKVPNYPAGGTQPTVTVDDLSKLPDGKTEATFDVPVIVTYPDGTKDTAIVKVTVGKQKEADKYTPETTPEVVEKGGKVDLTDNVKPIVDENGKPVDVTVKDVTPAGTIDTNELDDYVGKVEITYPDGSKEVVDVPVKVVDSRKDADKYTPNYKDTTARPGDTVVIPNLGDKFPEGTKVEVGQTKLPEGTEVTVDKNGNVSAKVPKHVASGTVLEIPLVITYPRWFSGYCDTSCNRNKR